MSADDPTTGSGRGGAMGTPSGIDKAVPPSQDQENNTVVSGGGLAGTDDQRDAEAEARETGPSAD